MKRAPTRILAINGGSSSIRFALYEGRMGHSSDASTGRSTASVWAGRV